MTRFSLTDLNNKSGEVVEAAYSGPVEITSRGKRKFILMTASQYDRLAGKSVQRSFHVSTMNEDEREEFASALEAVARDSEFRDE